MGAWGPGSKRVETSPPPHAGAVKVLAYLAGMCFGLFRAWEGLGLACLPERHSWRCAGGMFPGLWGAVEEIRDAGDTKKWAHGPQRRASYLFGSCQLQKSGDLGTGGQGHGRFSNRKLPVSSEPENGHFVRTWL